MLDCYKKEEIERGYIKVQDLREILTGKAITTWRMRTWAQPQALCLALVRDWMQLVYLYRVRNRTQARQSKSLLTTPQ